MATKLPKGDDAPKGITKTAWFLQDHPDFRTHPVLGEIRAKTRAINILLTHLNQSGTAKVAKGMDKLSDAEKVQIEKLYRAQKKTGKVSIREIAMQLQRGHGAITRHIDSLGPKT